MSSANFPKEVVLGYAGEKNARAIEFDCSEELARWPNSSPIVMYSRPGEDKDDAIYAGTTEVDGTTVRWIPDEFAMQFEGTGGYAQVFFEIENENEEIEILGKSPLIRTVVSPALLAEAGEAALQPYVPLLYQMRSATEAAENITASMTAAADAASTAANAANTATNAAMSAIEDTIAAADSLENLTVAANAALSASATVSKIDGHYHIAFNLPKGDAFTYSDFTQEQLDYLRNGIYTGHEWLSDSEVDAIFSDTGLQTDD